MFVEKAGSLPANRRDELKTILKLRDSDQSALDELADKTTEELESLRLAITLFQSSGKMGADKKKKNDMLDKISDQLTLLTQSKKSNDPNNLAEEITERTNKVRSR